MRRDHAIHTVTLLYLLVNKRLVGHILLYSPLEFEAIPEPDEHTYGDV